MITDKQRRKLERWATNPKPTDPLRLIKEAVAELLTSRCQCDNCDSLSDVSLCQPCLEKRYEYIGSDI